MKRFFAVFLLAACGLAFVAPSRAQVYGKPKSQSQAQASTKEERKQQKAHKKYAKAQKKAERKMLKTEKKNSMRYPSKPY
jgi:hypothetical protein